ncbi:diphosphate--fructose-6-phosphate 1-phosphotransferase [Salibacterium halotolerans]|uniref:6-phosphofructokinase 1 n=1 Tax=Salibacterium halotolerans TaxID=1884432 RepID=A0A1I5LBN2_9BACI|nr:diphosphate--fructose-6-phosphate 1-phosphotransferase [Salibacterium halotolerans]SFO94680.1 6-phosphofructokinase 1 [Salibacterium halotolerans]
MKHIAIGQSGGPTAVINATLAGFVRTLYKDHQLTFIRNGYEGLAEDVFFEGTKEMISGVLDHERVPGACLGAGRYGFTREKVKQSVKNLRSRGVQTLVFMGGNGTMEALHDIQQEADQQHYPLQVIGLPKTVDNDLAGTDHAPGFGSAAKYAAMAARDMSRDLQAMNNFEQVRILETMGRNAGWLAATSGFFNEYPEDGPHVISLPECPMKPQVLVQQTESALETYGSALIVVSEGSAWSGDEQVEKEIVNGRPVLGGVSREVEELLKENLGVMVRSELLGMNQRSFSPAVSTVDLKEAIQTGETGAEWVLEERSGVMASLKRISTSPYRVSFTPVWLEAVEQSGERKLPSKFINDQDAFRDWLRPLLGEGLEMYPPPFQRRDHHVIRQNQPKQK